MTDYSCIQLVSDVHYDVRKNVTINIPAVTPTLVVAGDVLSHADRNYRDKLNELYANHLLGAYVPGNHDVWHSTAPVHKVHQYMSRVCASLNTPVVPLVPGNWGLDVPGTDTRILGATLWTHVSSSMRQKAPTLINDYKYIKTSPHNYLTVDVVNEMHYNDKEWIRKAIRRANQDHKKSIVVTHHAPDIALSVHNPHGKATSGIGLLYYANDMGNVMKMQGISAWLYGHTHEALTMNLPGLKYPFITNAMGYPDENTGFSPTTRIKIL